MIERRRTHAHARTRALKPRDGKKYRARRDEELSAGQNARELHLPARVVGSGVKKSAGRRHAKRPIGIVRRKVGGYLSSGKTTLAKSILRVLDVDVRVATLERY